MRILLGERVNLSEGGTLIRKKRRRAFFLIVIYRVVRPKDPDATWAIGPKSELLHSMAASNLSRLSGMFGGNGFGDVVVGIRRHIDQGVVKIDQRNKQGAGPGPPPARNLESYNLESHNLESRTSAFECRGPRKRCAPLRGRAPSTCSCPVPPPSGPPSTMTKKSL